MQIILNLKIRLTQSIFENIDNIRAINSKFIDIWAICWQLVIIIMIKWKLKRLLLCITGCLLNLLVIRNN
jgi:hypothetical protein